MKLNLKQKIQKRMNLETFYSVYIFSQFFFTFSILICLMIFEMTQNKKSPSSIFFKSKIFGCFSHND